MAVLRPLLKASEFYTIGPTDYNADTLLLIANDNMHRSPPVMSPILNGHKTTAGQERNNSSRLWAA